MMKFKRYIYPILSIIFFLMAIIQEKHTLSHNSEVKLIQSFRKSLLTQDWFLSEQMEKVAKKLGNSPKTLNYLEEFADLNKLYSQK